MESKGMRASLRVIGVGAVLGMGSMSAHAALVVPTGGEGTGGAIAASYGEFSGTSTYTWKGQDIGLPFDVTETTGEMQGELTDSGISATVTGYGAGGPPLTPTPVLGSGWVRISFDLLRPAVARYSFVQEEGPGQWGWNADPRSSIATLKDASGNIILGCMGEAKAYGVRGGCSLGEVPDQLDQAITQRFGSIALDAGHYEFYVDAVSSWAAGVPINGDAAFNVSFVPLPGAAWLFASGLGLLGWARRRVSA